MAFRGGLHRLLISVACGWLSAVAPLHAYSIYVTNEKDNTLSVIDGDSLEVVDTETLKISANVLVDARPRAAQFTPDGKRLFTTNGISGDVAVIDLVSQRVEKSVKVGRLPWGIVVRP